MYCVVRTTFFDSKFLEKYFVFFFTEKPQSVPVQAVVGSLLDASLGCHRGCRRRHGRLHVHLHLQGLILFLLCTFLMAVLSLQVEIKILLDPPSKPMGPLQIVWFIFGALVKQVESYTSHSKIYIFLHPHLPFYILYFPSPRDLPF